MQCNNKLSTPIFLLLFILMFVVSCSEGQNHHLNANDKAQTLINRDGPISIAPPRTDNFAPNFDGYFYYGSCQPNNSLVTFTSPDSVPRSVTCMCNDLNYKCGPVVFSGEGPNGFKPEVVGVIVDPNENRRNIEFMLPIYLPHADMELPSEINENETVELKGECKSDDALVYITSPNTIVPTQSNCKCDLGKFDCGTISLTGGDGDSSITIETRVKDVYNNETTQSLTDVIELIPNVDLNVSAIDFNDLNLSQWNLSGTCFSNNSDIKVTNAAMIPTEQSCQCQGGNFNCGLIELNRSIVNYTMFTTEIKSSSQEKTVFSNEGFNIYKSRLTNLSELGYQIGDELSLSGECSPEGATVVINSESLTDQNHSCPCQNLSFDCGLSSVTTQGGRLYSHLEHGPYSSTAYEQVFEEKLNINITGPYFSQDGGQFTVTGTCNTANGQVTVTAPTGVTPTTQTCTCESNEFSCGVFTDVAGIQVGHSFNMEASLQFDGSTVTTSRDVKTVYLDLNQASPIGYEVGDVFKATGKCYPNGTNNIVMSSPMFTNGNEICSCSGAKITCPGKTLQFPAGVVDASITAGSNVTYEDQVTLLEKPWVELVSEVLPHSETHMISGMCGGNNDTVTVTAPTGFTPTELTCTCEDNEFSCGELETTGDWPTDFSPRFDAKSSNGSYTATDHKDFPVIAIDVFPPNPHGYEVGETYNPEGRCYPDSGNITLASPAFQGVSVNCSCNDGDMSCPAVTLVQTEKEVVAELSSGGKTATDVTYIEAKPSFSCPILPTAAGTFLEGQSSSGSIAIPIKDALNRNVTVQVMGNGFFGFYTGTLTENDNSVIVPITYDGSGFGGASRRFSVTSSEVIGSCEGEAYVMNNFELAFGIYSSIYVEDGTDGICGKQMDDDIYCWGKQSQFHGGAADGSLVKINMPDGIVPLQPLPLEANGYSITTTGELISWGQYNRTANHFALGRQGVIKQFNGADFVTGWPTERKVKVLLGEHNEACTIMDNNDLYCWGRNQHGELGTGLNQTEITPVLVNTNVAQMMIGGSVHCVVKFDGQMYCAGDNLGGQLGDGTFTKRNVYVPVPGMTDVKEIQFIGNQAIQSTCALLNNGTVWCWGKNHTGQVGSGVIGDDVNSPSQVVGLTSVERIRGGVNHMCALKTDKTLWCWGANNKGQLGNGLTAHSATPVQVSGLTGVEDFGVGQDHSCALKNDKTAWCWGTGLNMRLGNSSEANATAPVQYGSGSTTPGFSEVHAIKIFRHDSCMLHNNDVFCVGKHSGANLVTPKFVIDQ